MNSTAFNVARVVGPALSASLLLVFAERGEGWAFLLNGMSYLVVILGLLAIHPKVADAPAAGDHFPVVSPNNVLAQFREGQRYIIHQTTLIGSIIVMAAAPGLFAFPVIQQIPAFARDVLAQPGDTDAMVAARNSAMVTAQGVGALLAAVMLTLLSTFRRKGCLMTAGQFAFYNCLVGRRPLAQHGADLANLDAGVAPFGSLLIGWIAQTWGAPTAASFGGLACLATYIAVNLKTPTARRFEG